jgi:clan AA aspartic protease
MALTYLPVIISNPVQPKRAIKLDFLIDSGAIYSVVPEKILRKLRIKPEEEREFTLADGRKIKRKLGIARFEYNGKKGGAPVIFGEKGDQTILGATALEAMGLALDPLKRELIPLPMVLG